MKLLKWLFGSRKPALNKPAVSRCEIIPFERGMLIKIKTKKTNGKDTLLACRKYWRFISYC